MEHGQFDCEGFLTEVERFLRDRNIVYLGDIHSRGDCELHVVACDLSSTHRPIRIYSSACADDHGISVVAAVKASIAAPLVFAPDTELSNYMVDGGVVANLPTHIFARQSVLQQAPILALTFKDERANEPHSMAGRFVRAIIDANMTYTKELTPAYCEIPIASKVSAFDFGALKDRDTVQVLINDGKKAAEEYLKTSPPPLIGREVAPFPAPNYHQRRRIAAVLNRRRRSMILAKQFVCRRASTPPDDEESWWLKYYHYNHQPGETRHARFEPVVSCHECEKLETGDFEAAREHLPLMYHDETSGVATYAKVLADKWIREGNSETPACYYVNVNEPDEYDYVAEDYRQKLLDRGYCLIATIPIIINSRVVGALQVASNVAVSGDPKNAMLPPGTFFATREFVKLMNRTAVQEIKGVLCEA